MRILITGPECTGKSTLAQDLSAVLTIPVLHEHARTHLEEYGPDYQEADLLTIAREHHQLLYTFPPEQPLILDTYLLNIKIWAEAKYGQADPWLIEHLGNIHFDHVLLTYPDLPWKQDGLRENADSGLHYFNVFLAEMKKLDWTFAIIKGSGPSRLQSALTTLQV